MLKQLKIANYALIDKLDISFAPGLTIITGETGAGKSIMMGALSLILGEKAESRAIRALDKKSVIEVVFNINEYGLQHFFADNDIEYYNDGDCILRREISPNGRSRAFINDTPVTLPVMRALSVQLIDIHSQHSNMLLSSHRYQLDILDNLHSDKALPITYHNEYEKYKRIETRIHELRETNERRKAEEDYLQFQLSQIAELKLQPGEDIELEASERRLSNVNEIKNLLWQCEQLLEGDDDGMNSILSGLAQVSANLSNLNRICDETGDMSDRLETVIIDIKDMSRSISAMQNDIVDDPAELERIRERLSNIYSLESKHRVKSVDELLELQNNFESQVSEIADFDEEINRLEKELSSQQAIVEDIAAKLSKHRHETSTIFEKQLKELAVPLGMKNLQFKIEFEKIPFSATGIDAVKFLFSFNKQQPLMPVESTASGGEISRLMLCIKSIIAKSMKLPTIIFDEVDTGVSGDIANRMGELMKEISKNIQVITITHLPQVAAKGDNHFKVYKQDTDESTFTAVRQLDNKERVMEIAAMLSGDKVSEAAINNARTLLNGN